MRLNKIDKLLKRLRILGALVQYIPNDIKAEYKARKIECVTNPMVLIVIHAYWYDEFKCILDRIHSLETPLDILVTLPESPDSHRIGALLNVSLLKHNLTIYECANEGRDIGPFVKALGKLDFLKYEFVIKIHTKRSQGIWFRSSVDSLIRSDNRLKALARKMHQNDVGILVHPLFKYPGYLYKSEQLSSYGIPISSQEHSNYDCRKWSFPAGSMFAIKPKLLNELLEEWGNLDFESEIAYSQYSLAHKIERKMGYDTSKFGFTIVATSIFDYFDLRSYFVKII
jgi:lipopolysaccharide biosynthesis protein